MIFHCARLSHPPYPPIASQSISRDVPSARARACQFAKPRFRERPRLPFTARNFLTRPTPIAPRRALVPGEHRFIVRVLRARRTPGHSFSIFLRPRLARAQRAVWLPCFLRVFGVLTRTIHCGKKRAQVAPTRRVLYTLFRSLLKGCVQCDAPDDNAEDARITDNLRRTIELTELGLALRRSVVQQGALVGDAMAQVMREIRRAKEQVWQRNPS